MVLTDVSSKSVVPKQLVLKRHSDFHYPNHLLRSINAGIGTSTSSLQPYHPTIPEARPNQQIRPATAHSLIVNVLIGIKTLQLSRHDIFCSILDHLPFSLISLALLDRKTVTRPHL